MSHRARTRARCPRAPPALFPRPLGLLLALTEELYVGRVAALSLPALGADRPVSPPRGEAGWRALGAGHTHGASHPARHRSARRRAPRSADWRRPARRPTLRSQGRAHPSPCLDNRLRRSGRGVGGVPGRPSRDPSFSCTLETKAPLCAGEIDVALLHSPLDRADLTLHELPPAARRRLQAPLVRSTAGAGSCRRTRPPADLALTARDRE